MLFLVGFIFLYLEYFLVTFMNTNKVVDDCYFFLLLVGFFFILLFGRMKLDIHPNLCLRKTSTIIYCSHFTIGVIISYTFRSIFGINLNLLFFVLTIFCAFLLSFVILKFESRYSILKFSH